MLELNRQAQPAAQRRLTTSLAHSGAETLEAQRLHYEVGAYICGEPAWDAEFNTADLFILPPMSRMSDRYAKHFLKASEHFLKM